MTEPLGSLRKHRFDWRALLDLAGSPQRRLACWLLGAHIPYTEWTSRPPFCCNCHRTIRENQ